MHLPRVVGCIWLHLIVGATFDGIVMEIDTSACVFCVWVFAVKLCVCVCVCAPLC